MHSRLIDENIARMKIAMQANMPRFACARITAADSVEQMVANARIGGFEVGRDKSATQKILPGFFPERSQIQARTMFEGLFLAGQVNPGDEMADLAQ